MLQLDQSHPQPEKGLDQSTVLSESILSTVRGTLGDLRTWNTKPWLSGHLHSGVKRSGISSSLAQASVLSEGGPSQKRIGFQMSHWTFM